MPDTGIEIREERRYWLKGTPEKPLPRGIEGPLELLATRSYRIDPMTTAPMSRQVRANALKVTIDLPEPQGIVARPIGYAGPGIRLLTSEAKWDFVSNLVQVGGGYIEVLSTELRSFGIGALFMNMAIGWAHAFHQDADAHQLSVQPDDYEEDRKRFYSRFGYSFSGRTNDAGNQLSDPTTIARLHLADHPSIESDANLKRKA